MLDTIKAIDENLFLFLNAQHNSFWDQAMWLFSSMLFWGPLYVWFLWLLHKEYPRHYWTVLVAIVLLITASDQLSNLAKYSFLRYRPTHALHLQDLVHTVNGYRGGMYGFYSAHSANSFSIVFFIIPSVTKRRNYLIPIALFYATLSAYSRIYLGVHYPGDILTGALMGVLTGTGFAYLHNRLRIKYLGIKS